MSALEILKSHNKYVAHRRQVQASLKSAINQEIIDVPTIDKSFKSNDDEIVAEIDLMLDTETNLDKLAKLFSSRHTNDSDDVISRQTKWLQDKESKIKEIMNKQEEDLKESLNFNPNLNNNSSSWAWAKRESEREQEKAQQREKEREAKKEIFRIQEELATNTVLLSPLNEMLQASQKKKKPKKKSENSQSSNNIVELSDLQKYEQHLKSNSNEKTVTISDFKTEREPSVERNISSSSSDPNGDRPYKFVALDRAKSPYQSKPKIKVKKPVVIQPPDEFSIDFKALNKVSVHNITQKDITDAQTWFSKLMRERKEIDTNNEEYQQPQEYKSTIPPSTTAPTTNMNNTHPSNSATAAAPSKKKLTNTTLNSKKSAAAVATAMQSLNSTLSQSDKKISKTKDTTATDKMIESFLDAHRNDEKDICIDNEYDFNETSNQQQPPTLSFFHDSSTDEKGRHNLHEPLSFDSRTITRRVDSKNSNVSYLVGCHHDSADNEIITIVFDRKHFSELSAQTWWTLNEIRIRKEIEGTKK